MIGNDSDVSEGDVSEPGSVERSPLHSMDISLPATPTESSNLSSSMEDSDLQYLIDVETCRGRVKVRGQRGGSKRGRGRGRKWKRRGGRQGSRGSGGRSGIRGSSGQGSSRPSSYLKVILLWGIVMRHGFSASTATFIFVSLLKETVSGSTTHW